MIKKLVILLGVLATILFGIYRMNVIWPLAPLYEIQEYPPLEVPIMDMKAYEDIINDHRRPYVFELTGPNGGAVLVCGLDHTKDPANPQLDTLKYHWEQFNPGVALVEGRVGNLFWWAQDPIEELGEGGLTTALAYKKGIARYSWEPPRQGQIIRLLEEGFTKEEIVMHYVFRAYVSNSRYGTYDDPEAALQDFLDSRADYDGIRDVYTRWEELDVKWQRDFPTVDWRTYPAGYGWPAGYLDEIANRVNLMRDEHLLAIVDSEIRKGHRVFAVMGASHAPRIEKALAALLAAP